MAWADTTNTTSPHKLISCLRAHSVSFLKSIAPAVPKAIILVQSEAGARFLITRAEIQHLFSVAMPSDSRCEKKLKLFLESCLTLPVANSGKSKWELSNGGLSPLSTIFAQSSAIVHFCGPFGPLSKGNFRRKMTTSVGNRGQLWTRSLSPHLLSPHSDLGN